MLFQASFGVLEGPKQIEFYQYTSYFVLISTLSLSGKFTSWLKYSVPLIFLATLCPLFFKDSSYFTSIGGFAYTFTTPIAVLFVSFIIARLSSGKFEALEKNLILQRKLLEIEAAAKIQIESELKIAKEKIIANASSVALAQIAAQVSHDIRSPLASLISVVQNAHGLEEKNRIMLRNGVNRIRDISTNLLQQNRNRFTVEVSNSNGSGTVQLSKEPKSIEHLANVAEMVVAEKSSQIDNIDDIQIELSFEYGLFSEIQPIEFGRVLSNLLSNSLESLNSRGSISLNISSNDEKIYIDVKDNGKGIPKEVLPHLMIEGKTFGKKNGNGLGLFHAKNVVEYWSGSIEISSQVSQGPGGHLKIPHPWPGENPPGDRTVHSLVSLTSIPAQA